VLRNDYDLPAGWGKTPLLFCFARFCFALLCLTLLCGFDFAPLDVALKGRGLEPRPKRRKITAALAAEAAF